MADAADRAADLQASEIAAGIAAARLPTGPGSRICVECEAEIPPRRRATHPSATRCVPCQESMETARAR